MSNAHDADAADDTTETAVEKEEMELEIEEDEAAMAQQMRNMARRIGELEAVVLALKEEELRNRAKEERDRATREEVQQRMQEERDHRTAEREGELRQQLTAQQQRLAEQKEESDRWKQRADQLAQRLNERQPQPSVPAQPAQPAEQAIKPSHPASHQHTRRRSSITRPSHSRRGSLSGKGEARQVSAEEVEAGQDSDELHQTIHLLEEEIATLNHRIAVTHTATVLALQQQLHASQRAMLDMRAERSIDEQVGVMERRVDEAEEEALRLRCDKLDLTFVVEQSRVRQERVERRLRQVERVNNVLGAFFDASRRQQAGGGLIMNEVEGLVREMTHIAAMDSGAAEEDGWRRVGAMDVYEVMHVVKRVVLKLKAEVDESKRRGDGKEERDRLVKENKKLERRVKEMEEEQAKRAADKAEYERTSGLHALLRKELKREREAADKLKRKVDDLSVLLREKERGAEEVRLQAEGEWRGRVEQLEAERRGQTELIVAMRAQLDSSIHIAQQLQAEVEAEREARERSERRGKEEKEKEVKHSHREEDEHDSEVSAELLTELSQLREECARLQLENAAYSSELSAFDESFFDEIEDLKFRYASAVKLLQQMREAGYAHQHSPTGGFG